MDLILPALTRRPSLVTGCHSFSSLLPPPRRPRPRPRPRPRSPRSPRAPKPPPRVAGAAAAAAAGAGAASAMFAGCIFAVVAGAAEVVVSKKVQSKARNARWRTWTYQEEERVWLSYGAQRLKMGSCRTHCCLQAWETNVGFGFWWSEAGRPEQLFLRCSGPPPDLPNLRTSAPPPITNRQS
jgi:hypothetical protein